MKNGFAIFFAAFVVLGGSWCAFVLAPELQLGGAKQTSVLNSSDVYPVQRSGDATLGLQVYRANGCAACHTEQVQQEGISFNVVVISEGKNPAAVISAMGVTEKEFLFGLNKDTADKISDRITAAGGKTEIHVNATGPDISRGWGLRHSVAEDFLYDYPVQSGSLRAGPDLAGVGARLPDANWQLLHLYAPRSVVKDSVMPAFKFLFDVRKINGVPSPDALEIPLTQQRNEFAPPAGYEIIPTEDAKNLAAYLLSLHADVPLYDAPFTSLAASTNAPAKKP
jgi:cbb3-type cytochrome oxidase cytochrome c subunit